MLRSCRRSGGELCEVRRAGIGVEVGPCFGQQIVDREGRYAAARWSSEKVGSGNPT